jgi:hypothetical protein
VDPPWGERQRSDGTHISGLYLAELTRSGEVANIPEDNIPEAVTAMMGWVGENATGIAGENLT